MSLFIIVAQFLSLAVAHLSDLSPTSTIIPAYLEKRDAGVATLTLGPVSEYLRAPVSMIYLPAPKLRPS